jgi:hypothetical protein
MTLNCGIRLSERSNVSVCSHPAASLTSPTSASAKSAGVDRYRSIAVRRCPACSRSKFGRANDLFEGPRYVGARLVVGRLQYPHQLAHRDGAQAHPFTAPGRGLDGCRRQLRLRRIVLHEIADEHVGVEADHRPAARLRMTACMAPTLTGRRPLTANRPFKGVTP